MEKYREAMGIKNTALFKFTLGLGWIYLEKFIKKKRSCSVLYLR